MSRSILYFFFFFFQAEDGIRDKLVTGVQTCALPIIATRGSTGLPACAGSAPARSSAACSNWRRSGKRRGAACGSLAQAENNRSGGTGPHHGAATAAQRIGRWE